MRHNAPADMADLADLLSAAPVLELARRLVLNYPPTTAFPTDRRSGLSCGPRLLVPSFSRARAGKPASCGLQGRLRRYRRCRRCPVQGSSSPPDRSASTASSRHPPSRLPGPLTPARRPRTRHSDYRGHETSRSCPAATHSCTRPTPARPFNPARTLSHSVRVMATSELSQRATPASSPRTPRSTRASDDGRSRPACIARSARCRARMPRPPGGGRTAVAISGPAS